MNDSREQSLLKARKAAHEEKILKPLLAAVILLTATLSFVGLMDAKIALLAIVPAALAGLSHPKSRGAPGYAELLALVDINKKTVDPIVDVLSRKP